MEKGAQLKEHRIMRGKEKKAGGGLEFMAIRFNVVEKRRQLRTSKEVTPAEYYLLEEIELGTLGARNARSTICSKAEFFLEDLSRNLGYKSPNKIWTLLKSLHNKKLIIREATRSKGREIIGLDPTAFGQVLINKHHDMEAKKHLKCVVDNSRNLVDIFEEEHTNQNPIANVSWGISTRNVCETLTKRVGSESQHIENKEEKDLLDSSRCILEGFRGKNRSGESFTRLGETGTGTGASTRIKQLSDPAEERKRQFKEIEITGAWEPEKRLLK